MQGLRCEDLPVQYVVSRFTQDRSGATALIFGLLAPVFIAATGAAIAYSQASNVHTAQQNALDAAVLAATGLASRNHGRRPDRRSPEGLQRQPERQHNQRRAVE